MRARLALLVSQTQCEMREIKLSAKPASLLKASPKGTVPVLILPNGQILDESRDIMTHALTRHDPEHWLSAQNRHLIDQTDTPFKFHLDRYKYATRHNTDPTTHRTEALTFLQTLTYTLTATPYLSGQTFGLTDAAIAPFIRQFAATDPEWFSTQNLAPLQTWLNTFLTSPLFTKVMTRYPVWAETDATLAII